MWLNGSDNAPPTKVERAYLDVEAETHWPNPIISAASSQVTAGGGLNGVKMTGPYDYVAPSYWYVDKQNGGAYGFNTETSPGPAIPSLASREKFLSDPQAWPPTADWSYHYGGGEFKDLKVLDSSMEAVYGKPQSAADYERISQTMEYDSERAMYEAYSRNKYTSTGVIQWMLNNAWPSMIWHLYDYYLDAGAGYFGAKKACEPVHIQYSYDDRTIVVVNSTYQRMAGLHASVELHNAAWKELFKQEAAVDAGVDSSQIVLTLPESLYTDAERLFFIDLKLTDDVGKLVSRNFYWVPGTLTAFDWSRTDYTHTPAARHEDLTALANLPAAKLMATAAVSKTSRGREVRVELENPSSVLAFQVSAAVRTSKGELIAPVIWSDNWVELAPSEKRVLTALLPESGADAPVVEIGSWNAGSQRVTPTLGASQ